MSRPVASRARGELMTELHSPSLNRMTAGDVARAVCVDLKTVHNWVQRGNLRGARTRGGHLRFLRTEIVRFLHGRGRAVPEDVVVEAPRVVAVALPAEMATTVGAAREASLFEALLGFGSTAHDVIVVGLDEIAVERVRELAVALVHQPVTEGVAVIGLSSDPRRREEFLAGGADVVLAGAEELPSAIAFVCGRGEGLGVTKPRLPERTERGERVSGVFGCLSVPELQVASAL